MPSAVTNHRIDLSYTTTSGNDGVLTSTKVPGQAIWQDTVDRGGGIPHYRKVIAMGGNATTSLSGTESKITSTPGSCHWKRNNKFLPDPLGNLDYIVEGHMLQFGIPTNSFDLSLVTADNLALTRYYSNLRSVTSKFQGLVVTGEMREMLNMIKSPARSFRRGVSSYLNLLQKKGPRVKRSKRPSFVRDTWLEYNFGWRPLIKDIDSAIQAWYSSKWVHPIFEMVKGTGAETVVRGDSDASASFGPLQWFWNQRTTEEAYVKYFGIQHSNGNGISNSHHYGFRPSEFIPTIWELIPYSFLVDYFTNIGDIVQSWSYRFIRNGWTARTVRQTLLTESSNERTFEFNVSDSTYNYEGGGHPGHRTAQKKQVVRFPSVDPGLPVLEARCPGMDSRWVNILALSNQLSSTRRALSS